MQLGRLQILAAASIAAAGSCRLGVARAQVREPAPPAASSTSGAGPAAAPPSSIDVRFASEFATYADTDHVFVQTPSIAAAIANPTAGWSVDGRYLVDVVSAASVDIVSTASRNWREVRHEGTFNASYKPGAFGVSATGSVSSEPDYLSWTAGGAFTLDTLNKNVSWLLGYYHTQDVAGRTGTPFSVFSHTITREAFKGGATVLVSPKAITSLVADVIVENGDQSKPYRYVPLFAPGTFVARGATVSQVTALRVSARPHEQLPLTRDRFAISGQLAYRFHQMTLRLDERIYADSWAMVATTTDARLLLDLGPRIETGPHARVHLQSAVNFWQRAYVLDPGLNFPAFRTGNRELGPLFGATGGWTFDWGMGRKEEPRSWVLGFDLNLTSTHYLDDIYITSRISVLSGIILKAQP